MMSVDTREAILVALMNVAKTVVDNEKFAYRNQTSIPETSRPAIVILDGDETVSEEDGGYGKGRPSVAPKMVNLMPEIFILVETKAAHVGTVLNAFRTRFVKAIMTDGTLLALCHEIRYDGFATGLAIGRSMEGEGGLGMTFRYVLRPDKL